MRELGMYFRAIAGIVAGLCAGVISGVMFLLMRVPGMDGMTYTVLAVLSRAVGTNDPSIGWSYHLINTAVLGAAFGLIVGKAVSRLLSAIGLGLVASVLSWGLANLILLPQFRDDVTGFTEGPLGSFGLATLIGYTVQGILLGVIFLWVYNPIAVAESGPRSASVDGETAEERRRIAH
jgi:hypothetical protein